MAGIYKAYDIRGVYGDTLTTDIAYRIGRAFATFVSPRNVVVGRDMRPHSKPLFDALARGLTEQGSDVTDLGLCSTPMSNFANGRLQADACIMITASHNPAEYNGFKLSRKNAIPIGGDSGIADIERIVQTGSFSPPPPRPGRIRPYDILPEYVAHVRRAADIRRPVKIAADLANAMGSYEVRALEGLMQVVPLFPELDGTFPNHEANPAKTETLRRLQETVRAEHCDFGVAFDGDADRAGFVDEKGEIVPMDLLTALIAQDILEKKKSGVVLYDLRSSWAVAEIIREHGGTPILCRVGHAFIKQQMRDTNALFAGELSGHYYFRDNYNTESSSLATIFIANMVSKKGQTLSQLMKPIRRYFASGEVNLKVKDPAAVLERLRKRYADGKQTTLDGVSVEYADWWFNVRASNTEPLVRLNLEARNPRLMAEKRDEVFALMQQT